jgi:hypothetical protein
MRRRRFLASVHSVETGEERRLATFYIMNTSVNLNGWGVSDKALEEALPTILRKPLGCGPGYRVDAHYPEPMHVGRFVRSEKPDGYALGVAEITDQRVWGHLVSGEWGPISVVIHSYRETCSGCLRDLTGEPDPFSHDCIADGDAYLIIESFVFERADFIDSPAVPQAGLVEVAATEAPVPLELLARFYVTQSRRASAVPWRETPRAPEDRAWDADAAEAHVRAWAGGPGREGVDWARYRMAFAWYDAENPESFGGYKLLHHDVVDGGLRVVWRGVAAAMQALLGARGGVDIPRGDRRQVYGHLAKEYGLFGREPPKYRESQSTQDPAQGPGAHQGPNPEEKERKRRMENELQQRVTLLERQLRDERKAKEQVESQLTVIRAREHAQLVEEVLEARLEAGLVDDVETERARLTAKSEDDLHELQRDAIKAAAGREAREAAPKAKYTVHGGGLATAMEDARMRLFGRRNT